MKVYTLHMYECIVLLFFTNIYPIPRLFSGGTCISLIKQLEEGKPSFECRCHERYIGSQCELDTNPCASQPCLYGGICSSSTEGLFCIIINKMLRNNV